MPKSTRSVKYCLTFEGHKIKTRKVSTKPIIFHSTSGKFYTDCGTSIHSPLDRKPTGKRYTYCTRCERSRK